MKCATIMYFSNGVLQNILDKMRDTHVYMYHHFYRMKSPHHMRNVRKKLINFRK